MAATPRLKRRTLPDASRDLVDSSKTIFGKTMGTSHFGALNLVASKRWEELPQYFGDSVTVVLRWGMMAQADLQPKTLPIR